MVDKQYLQFCCAHFILFEGRREPLHGHNYHCGVTLQGELGPEGFVLDFGDLKRAARGACGDLDHLVLLPSEHPELQIERQGGALLVRYHEERFELPAADVRLLPLPNTTSEHLARYLAGEIVRRLPEAGRRRVATIEVHVEEAPGQRASFRATLPAEGHPPGGATERP